MHTSNVFNVNHLVQYRGENSNPDSKLKDAFFQDREDDASHIMKNKEFFIFIFFLFELGFIYSIMLN